MGNHLHLHLPPEIPDSQKYMITRGVKPYANWLNGPQGDVNNELQGEITVSDLRQWLLRTNYLEKTQLVSVRGTLYPAVLMSSGWWENEGKARINDFRWRDGLQEWLFNGFDLWGPSWDYTWNFDDKTGASHAYFIAQLGDGDEANSIPVIVPEPKASKLKELFFESWGGIEARVTGLLGHRSQFSKDLSKADFLGGLLDYCVWLDHDNKDHRIRPLSVTTEIYSGYLWKCLAPKKWLMPGKRPKLDQVYFLWEHTNFANRDAVRYNLDSLAHKEDYLREQHGDMILIQKSSSLVPGEPIWSAQEIYNLLTGKMEDDI